MCITEFNKLEKLRRDCLSKNSSQSQFNFIESFFSVIDKTGNSKFTYWVDENVGEKPHCFPAAKGRSRAFCPGEATWLARIAEKPADPSRGRPRSIPSRHADCAINQSWNVSRCLETTIVKHDSNVRSSENRSLLADRTSAKRMPAIVVLLFPLYTILPRKAHEGGCSLCL